MRMPVNDPGPAPKAMPSRLASAPARLGQDLGAQHQRALRVRLARVLVAHVPARAVADGHAAPLGRSLERRGSASGRFYSTAVGATSARHGPPPSSGTIAPRRRHALTSHLPARSVAHVHCRPSPPRRATPSIVAIESLDQEGRGIARVDGKAMFVEGALPGEARDDHDAEEQADLRDRARRRRSCSASAARVAPRCPHFGVCGGCTLQHFDAAAQVAAKQRALEDALWHIGRVRARAAAAGDPRPGVGLPPPRAAVGPLRREEGRRAGRLPRAEVELRRRHDVVRDPAAEDLGAAAGAARAGRRAVDPRPPAADRAGGRRVAPARPPTVATRGSRVRAGAAHPRAADRGRRGPPARVRRRPRRAVLPADRRAPRPRCRSIRPSRALAYDAAGVRAGRSRTRRPSSRRSIRRSTACWCAARSRCSTRGPASASPTSSAASATSRCRSPGAARTSSASRAARRSSARAAENAAAQRPRRTRDVPRRQPVRGHGREHRGARAVRQGADRSAARRRDRARQGAAARTAGRGASSTCRAIRRRSRATPRCWCRSAATRWRRPASSTCSRTPRTSSRSRCSSADAGGMRCHRARRRTKKGGPAGRPFLTSPPIDQSRWPEKASSRLSRLMKMLYRLRNTPSVAVT